MSGVPVKMYLSSTRGACSEMYPRKFHTTRKTALSKTWKMTPTTIRVPVNKIYVTFSLWRCSQTEGYGECFLRFPDHTWLDTDSGGRTVPNE
jgi:hypothetical protein